MARIGHFRELRVYRRAFDVAMAIFELSRSWPGEERFALTSQIRRSSRAVCAAIAEAWRKRRYPNHFISKLTDADAEAAETQNWLDFACACGYLTAAQGEEFSTAYDEIARGLVGMMNHPESWCGPAQLVREPTAEYLVSPSDSDTDEWSATEEMSG